MSLTRYDLLGIVEADPQTPEIRRVCAEVEHVKAEIAKLQPTMDAYNEYVRQQQATTPETRTTNQRGLCLR